MADLILGSTTAISESGGAVALGTGVTMANATFPAGHVIQTVTKNDFQGTTTMTGTTWTATQNTCAITPIETSSKILVQVSQPIHVQVSTSFNDGGGAVAIFRDINGGGYPAVGSPTHEFNNGSSEINVYLYSGGYTMQNASRPHYTWLDSPTHNKTEVTYKLYLKQWSTRHNLMSNEWSGETGWILQEIAQ